MQSAISIIYILGQSNYGSFIPNMAYGYSNRVCVMPNTKTKIEEIKTENDYLQVNVIVKNNYRTKLLGKLDCNNVKKDPHCKYWDKTDEVLRGVCNNFEESIENLNEILHNAIYYVYYPNELSDSTDDESDIQEELPLFWQPQIMKKTTLWKANQCLNLNKGILNA